MDSTSARVSADVESGSVAKFMSAARTGSTSSALTTEFSFGFAKNELTSSGASFINLANALSFEWYPLTFR